jgi:hypothetical protein
MPKTGESKRMNKYFIMKRFLLFILIGNFINFTFGQCINFENGKSNWKLYNLAPNASAPTNSNMQTFQNGNNSSKGLYVEDKSGATNMYNNVDFVGDYTPYFGKCLCFDIKMMVNNATVKPYVIFYKGFNPSHKIEMGVNPQKAIKFTANSELPVNSTFKNFCVSFGKCDGSYLPNNIDGTWTVYGNGGCNTFQEVLSNVEGIMLSVDMGGWNGTEKFVVDNFCRDICRSGAEPIDAPNLPGPTEPFDKCDCIPENLYNTNLTASLFEPRDFSGQINSFKYKVKYDPSWSFGELNKAWNNWINLKYGLPANNLKHVVHQYMLFEITLNPNGTIASENKIDEFWSGPPYGYYPYSGNEFDITLSSNKNYLIRHGVYYGGIGNTKFILEDGCGWKETRYYLSTSSGETPKIKNNSEQQMKVIKFNDIKKM